MPELHFDRFVLDTDQRLLRCSGEVIDLQPLVFDLLSFLAKRPRKVVSKAELLPGVWRSSFVTESVVARAVMKARRALLDDAQEPRLLRTVPRAGYLLDAEVQERPGPARSPLLSSTDLQRHPRTVLLPVEDLTGNPALRWMSRGLMGLLFQWLESSGRFSLAPMEELQSVWARLNGQEDAVELTCSDLGASEAIKCQLSWEQDRFLMKAWRMSSTSMRPVFEGRGEDAIELSRSLADELIRVEANSTTVHNRTIEVQAKDNFWLEQLAMVVDMQQGGRSRQALDLLLTCLPHVQPNPQTELLHAQLLHACHQPDEAVKILGEALARDEAALPDQVRLSMVALRAQCDFDADRLVEARNHFEQALALTLRDPKARALRPELLSRTSRVAGRQNDAEAAIRLAEAAVEEAGQLGQLNLQTRAWLVLTAMLRAMDLPYRAEEALAHAKELAERSGVVEYQARAMRAQAAWLEHHRRYQEALVAVRRSVALWVRTTDRSGQLWTQLFELWILIQSGQLEDAGKLAASLSETPDLLLAHRGFLQFTTTLIEWRHGKRVVAVERLRALVQRARNAGSLFARVAQAELVWMEIGLGHLAEAKAGVDSLGGLQMMGAIQHRQAGLALAEGDRARAVELLRVLWRTGQTRGREGSSILVNLTWLLLETAPVGFHDAELDTLFSHVLELCEEPLEVRVLRAAYLLRQNQGANAREEWDGVVQSSVLLQQHCPMLLTRSYREAMATRMPPRLTELLCRVCW